MAKLSEPGLDSNMTVQEAQKEVQYRHQRILRKMRAAEEKEAPPREEGEERNGTFFIG